MSRNFSIEDTRKDLIPLISRYKSVKDMRSDLGTLSAPGGAATWTHEWLRPDTQALAFETMEIWAWKPFVIKGEPFPYPRIEKPVSLKEAGFNKVERKFLKKKGVNSIKPLPAIPIMDRHVRNIMKMISHDHGVTLDASHVVDQVNELHKKFSTPEAYGWDVLEGGASAVSAGPRWEWTPYYIFVKMPIKRLVLKLPNGAMLEDMMFDGMQALNTTQNVLLGHLLERQAIIEKERREIAIMLGYEELLEEEGRTSKVDDILKKEYPQFDFDKGEINAKWLEKEIKEKKEGDGQGPLKGFQEFKENLGRIEAKSKEALRKLGLADLMFFYKTPYEKLMHSRMARQMQRGPGIAFLEIDAFLKKKAGVPGV
jgi:hypothetical protein